MKFEEYFKGGGGGQNDFKGGECPPPPKWTPALPTHFNDALLTRLAHELLTIHTSLSLLLTDKHIIGERA